MKVLSVLVWLLCSTRLVYSQECRQVTVCGENVLPPRGGGGEKGDVGAPGKAGSSGSKGSKGEVGRIGPKGMQGESCALGGFEDEIRERLTALEIQFRPPSCLTSSVYGRQTLRSGEEAFCDGGWTVFQMRFDGSVDFNNNWQECKDGFGRLDGEFWLGLDNIYNLTKNRGCKLRIDVWDLDEDHKFAEYSSFSVEDESDNYRLHIGGYSGTAGDSMNHRDSPLNNMQFTTSDRDNDAYGSANCAVLHHGPWWHNGCARAQLNQAWSGGSTPWQRMLWYTWRGTNPLKKSTMKVRCD